MNRAPADGEGKYDRQSNTDLAALHQEQFVAPGTSNNIVKTTVPLLGLISCNRRLLPQLVGAMRELQSQGLGGLVRTFNGCFSPRMQVGNPYALSRHAFGIAVDINAGANRFGQPPDQDPRLVDVMARWGFTWGGRWLVPDGMHFEFVRFVTSASPPAAVAAAAR